MNPGPHEQKRDLVLNPLEQAFLQDETRGQIKTYVGPCVINQTGQDRPVKYSHADRNYERCQLEAAVFKVPLASEGDYIVLENPAEKGERPEQGNVRVSPALNVGRKINIPGPCAVPLWPGQDATVVKGHNLRSNQYLLVRIYNEDEARQNWGQAVVKPAGGDQPAAVAADTNFVTGQLLIIKGTEVSFYIPPTGVEVLKDENGNYIRDAMTLERLTYCILVDEDGNKRYEKGPQVVFPEPTETFISNDDGKRKFKAIELNGRIQGLHIKVIAEYAEGDRQHKEGDELFLTGADTAIYYPRVEHSIIQYGDQKKHYATAIPAGEGRYVMNRTTGEIRTVQGPTMLLADPRTEVQVRRILSDKQCDLWYPGNAEAKAYNQSLRFVAQDSPSARSGFVSEGDIQKVRSQQNYLIGSSSGHFLAQDFAESVPSRLEYAASNVGTALLPDTFSRGTTHTPPRTITLDTKYEGVPAITVWTGYAVMVVNKRGGRRVEQGPCTVLLDYDESLEVLELSTGKPKNTDKVERTVYLRVKNNKVSDIVGVETADHVPVKVKLSYRVNFEGEPGRWFESENYVKLLCDHARSVLKGAVQKVKIEDFYRNGVDMVRDIILGKADGGERRGMAFEENGMHVTDVEVLEVTIDNGDIATLLKRAQHEVVSSNISISQAEKELEVTRRKEEIARDKAQAQAATAQNKYELDAGEIRQKKEVSLAKIAASQEEAAKNKELAASEEAVLDARSQAKLQREKAEEDQRIQFERTRQELRIQELQAESRAAVERFQAAQGGFSEALLALSSQETLQKVAQALSVQNFIGGRTFVDVVNKLFEGSPVQAILDKIGVRAAVADNGDGPRKPNIPVVKK